MTPSSFHAGLTQSGMMTPGSMTPGSAMSMQTNMTDPFGLLCGPQPPTPGATPVYAEQQGQMPFFPDSQCQMHDAMVWNAQGTNSWDSCNFWQTDSRQQMPMVTMPTPQQPQQAVGQPAVDSHMNPMGSAMAQPMPAPGQPNQQNNLMAIAMPQAVDGNMNSQQLMALLEAAANQGPYED